MSPESPGHLRSWRPVPLKRILCVVHVRVFVETRYFEEFRRSMMTVFGEDSHARRFDSTAAREGWHRLLQFMVDQLCRGLADAEADVANNTGTDH